MTIQDIIQRIEAFAPRLLQESYDNSGLQVGRVDTEVNSALLCIDITEMVIDEAIEAGIKFIISHHPLIFHGIKSLTGKNYIERIIIKALKNDITIYSAHTNLDNAQWGVNQAIAYKLKLQDIKVLEQKSNMPIMAGAGMVGFLEEPMEYLDFLQQLKSVFNCGVVKYSNPLGKKIHKVAVCGGSGSFLIPKAIEIGADMFVTGEIKYHDFFGNDEQIMLADIGHYESEQFTSSLIANIITDKYPAFELYVTKVNTNPINYL